jgi:1-acyl-sn-glycerol-3-phosphate acyltransferase
LLRKSSIHGLTPLCHLIGLGAVTFSVTLAQKTKMSTPIKNLISLVSSLWVALNLSFWLVPLLMFTLIKILVPVPPITRLSNAALEYIYRAAVWVDSFWMTKVIGIKIHFQGELPDHPAPIVVCNHQTWFDIPVVQHAVTYHGPILKFLIKRQLVWVPIIGWICYALNFPRLNRGQGDNARQKDYSAIKAASNTLSAERGALLIFAEGTRFTNKKHHDQQAPYQHLLDPRPGGLKIALDTAPPGTPVVELTLVYRSGDTNFWRGLHGASPIIDVVVRNYLSDDIQDTREWLEARWREKDEIIVKQLSLAD